MLGSKFLNKFAAVDGQGKVIHFPVADSMVGTLEGIGTSQVTQALVDKVVAAGLDKLRSRHVATILFFMVESQSSAFELKMTAARGSVANYPYLLTELDVANRFATLLREVHTELGQAASDTLGGWICNLGVSTEEMFKIYRPWNLKGVKGFKFADDDFTPVEFNPAPDVAAGGGAGGAAIQGMFPANPFDQGASVAGRYFGGDQAYVAFKTKEYRGRIEMVFGSPLQLWAQPALIEQLIKLCAVHLPDRVGAEANKYFSLPSSMGSSQLSAEAISFRRQAALAALVAEVKPDSRSSLVGAMHVFAATMCCPGGHSQWLGVPHAVAVATAAFINASAVALNTMLHWNDRSLHFSLEEMYAFIATVLVERVIVPAFESQDEARCIELITTATIASELKEQVIRFRDDTRTNSGSRRHASASGKRANATVSDDSASSSDEASGHDDRAPSSSRTGAKSSSGGSSKKGKHSKLCYYFNESNCKDGDKCSFDHICSFCSTKNGKSHGHARTQCEVQKRAKDTTFRTSGPSSSKP